MSKYIHGLGFYLVFAGFTLKTLLESPEYFITLVVLIGFSFVNVGFFYAAGKFRSMAYHVLNRESLLAAHLSFQKPHPMLWGYYSGILAFLVAQIGFTVLVLWKALSLP